MINEECGSPRAHLGEATRLSRNPSGKHNDGARFQFRIVFVRPSDAVRFALLLHPRLKIASETSPRSLMVRVGIHMGEVIIEEAATQKRRDILRTQVGTASWNCRSPRRSRRGPPPTTSSWSSPRAATSNAGWTNAARSRRCGSGSTWPSRWRGRSLTFTRQAEACTLNVFKHAEA